MKAIESGGGIMKQSLSYSKKLADLASAKPIFAEARFAANDYGKEIVYVFGQNGLVAVF